MGLHRVRHDRMTEQQHPYKYDIFLASLFSMFLRFMHFVSLFALLCIIPLVIIGNNLFIHSTLVDIWVVSSFSFFL